jgi:hypothetical protein
MKTVRGPLGALVCLGVWACAAPEPATESTFDEATAKARCAEVQAKAPSPAAQKELDALVLSRRIQPEDCGELAELLEMVEETDAMLDDLVQANPDYLHLDAEDER